jgi:hypothetical protein
MIVNLIKRNNDCFIKIYLKRDDSDIIHRNNGTNKKIILDDTNSNDISSESLNEKSEITNINNNIIKEDTSFKSLDKILDDMGILWVSIFPIEKKFKNNKKIIYKKDSENDVYLYEFIATSNAVFKFGKNNVIFFGINKDISTDDYSIKTIKIIDQISCSVEPDSICQLNEKYICIGLQNYGLYEQTDGFALVDIEKREFFKQINGHNISSIYFDKENNFLISSMEVILKDEKNYFLTKIYKVNNNEEGKENKINFENIFQIKNGQNSSIISINKVPTLSNKDYIFVTSSSKSKFELVRLEFE